LPVAHADPWQCVPASVHPRVCGDIVVAWLPPATIAPQAAHAVAASMCVPCPFSRVAAMPGLSSPLLPLRSPPHEDSCRALCLVVPPLTGPCRCALSARAAALCVPPPPSSPGQPRRVVEAVALKGATKAAPLAAKGLHDASPRQSSSDLIYAILSTARTPDFPPQHQATNDRWPPPPRHSPLTDHTSPWSTFFR
jgi:hypothetical protein